MPLGLQPWHIIVVAIVALVVFGPRRLPEIGRGLGRALNEFRQGTREMTETFKQEMSQMEMEKHDVPASPMSTMAPISPSFPAPTETIAPEAPENTVAQPATGNYCTQCGASNPAGSKFCNKCGTALPV